MQVATADFSDSEVAAVIPLLLGTVKSALRMDVAFVSQFVEGKRVFDYVDVPSGQPVISAGASDPIEKSWCKKVVEGRLPQFLADAEPHIKAGTIERPAFPIGTHLSVPIRMHTGDVLGTVCCFSFAKSPSTKAADLDLLESVARLIAAGERRRTAR